MTKEEKNIIETIEFLKKEYISMYGREKLSEDINFFKEKISKIIGNDNNKKILIENALEEYYIGKADFKDRIKSSVFGNLYIHYCLYYYNYVTDQNKSTLDYWDREMDKFYNNIRKQNIKPKLLVSSFEEAFTEFLNENTQQRLKNDFLNKLSKEKEKSKQLIVDLKIADIVADIVYKYFITEIYNVIHDALNRNIDSIILDKNLKDEIVNTCLIAINH